jgi:dynactin 1
MTERESQASQAASLLSLNLRLQSSAVKTRTRNLDGELLALEASQAKDLLNIVQPYLPPVYVETDSDPTNCYLFFARLGRKCEILSSVVAKIVSVEEVLWGTTGGGMNVAEESRGDVTEAIVGICEVSS